MLDRDVLWEFASLLAQAYESASLRRTLRHEREQMREFLDWLGARSGELTDAPMRLATMQRPPRAARPHRRWWRWAALATTAWCSRGC